MQTRRAFGLSSASLLLAPSVGRAQDACAVFTRDRQQAITPEEALQRLADGNDRFMAGQPVNCDLLRQAHTTAHGQAPFAVIIGCIDSRGSPEIVFDQRIGDVFTARVAGNIVNDDIVGSVEFATKLAGAKAIVVLGHSACGAIKGAIDKAQLGSLTQLLQNIEPAIAEANPVNRTSKDAALVQRVGENNTRLAAAQLIKRSPILAEMVAAKEIVVAAAMHDLETGKVTFLS